MAALSTSDRSCLLLLDLQRKHAGKVSKKVQSNLERGLSVLDKVAELLQVPRYFAFPASLSDKEIPNLLGEHIFKWADGGSPWSVGGLIKAIADQNRTSLFLGGFWLDDSVTFAALGALADGYDVYIMLDVAIARRVDTREAAVERLVQAGVVPTTTFQVVSEWAASITDADVRAKLQETISEEFS